MNYREQQLCVTRIFENRRHEVDIPFNSVKGMSNVNEMRDIVLRALMKIMPDELAYYPDAYHGERYYVFNGKFYERIPADGIKYGIDEFLYLSGLPAVVRDNKSMTMYIGRILDMIKMHILNPRLSLMCFENCVVDMNVLKPMEFSPKHDVIKMYPFRYDRKEIFNCELWNKFLGESYIRGMDNEGVLPEKEKRRVLQMFLAACLADRQKNTFEYFAILQGTGANGKSVIQRVLTGMFGEEEMINIKLGHFSRMGDEGMRAVGALAGKRMIHCTESTKSDFKDMSMIKAIASGEPIVGRALGENIKTMSRPPLLICNSNYRWRVEDFVNKDDPDDDSVIRRAVIINFEKTIPLEKRDAQLADKLSKEYAGIFAWLVKGLVDLRANGYKLPTMKLGGVDIARAQAKIPVIATNGQKVSGTVAMWLKLLTAHPRPIVDKDTYKLERLATDLYASYEQFCASNGLVASPERKFSLDMVNLEYEKRRFKGSLYILYIEEESIAFNFDDYTPSLANEYVDILEEKTMTNEEFAESE